MKAPNSDEGSPTTVEREWKETRFNLDPTTWRVERDVSSDSVCLFVWTEGHTHQLGVRMTRDQYQKFLEDLAAAAEGHTGVDLDRLQIGSD